MKNLEMNAIEKEMANFNFDSIKTDSQMAITNIAKAETASDVKNEICNVWSKIGKYVKMAEAIPIVGKFVTILANLLDTLCAG